MTDAKSPQPIAQESAMDPWSSTFIEASRQRCRELDAALAAGSEAVLDYLTRDAAPTCWRYLITPHVKVMQDISGLWIFDGESATLCISGRLTQAFAQWEGLTDHLWGPFNYPSCPEVDEQATREVSRLDSAGLVLAQKIVEEFPCVTVWLLRETTFPRHVKVSRDSNGEFSVQPMSREEMDSWHKQFGSICPAEETEAGE